MERIKKSFQKFFWENDLNIVINWTLKIVDYLDVTLILVHNTRKPFTKPNNNINYTHKESKYPLHIIKQVPFYNQVTVIKSFFKWEALTMKHQKNLDSITN